MRKIYKIRIGNSKLAREPEPTKKQKRII